MLVGPATRATMAPSLAVADATSGAGRGQPATTTPASATRAATVPTTRPVVRAYASTAADWATTGAAAGVVSPNPSSRVAASAAGRWRTDTRCRARQSAGMS